MARVTRLPLEQLSKARARSRPCSPPVPRTTRAWARCTRSGRSRRRRCSTTRSPISCATPPRADGRRIAAGHQRGGRAARRAHRDRGRPRRVAPCNSDATTGCTCVRMRRPRSRRRTTTRRAFVAAMARRAASARRHAPARARRRARCSGSHCPRRTRTRRIACTVPLGRCLPAAQSAHRRRGCRRPAAQDDAARCGDSRRRSRAMRCSSASTVRRRGTTSRAAAIATQSRTSTSCATSRRAPASSACLAAFADADALLPLAPRRRDPLHRRSRGRVARARTRRAPAAPAVVLAKGERDVALVTLHHVLAPLR